MIFEKIFSYLGIGIPTVHIDFLRANGVSFVNIGRDLRLNATKKCIAYDMTLNFESHNLN